METQKLIPCVFNQAYEITISDGHNGQPVVKETFTPVSKAGKMYLIDHNGERRKVEARWFRYYGYFPPVDTSLF